MWLCIAKSRRKYITVYEFGNNIYDFLTIPKIKFKKVFQKFWKKTCKSRILLKNANREYYNKNCFSSFFFQ